VVLIPIILMGTVSLAYLNGYRWRFFALIFFLDAVIPGLYVLWRFVKHKGKDWDIHNRKERLPLFGLVVVCHGMGVLVAYLLSRHPLAELLLGLWGLALIYALITVVYKISVHAGVNATLAAMVFLFVDHTLWWIWLLPPLVAWARVRDKQHGWAQVVIGTALAPVWLFGVYRLLGVV
jgi:membrane-associated phospholipid phosphatase